MYVKEIFFSYQGEGIYIGAPTVFVRFAGCNLKCSYCDTKFARNVSHKDKRTLEDIYRKIATLISKFKPEFISLTGGEPLLQDNLLSLVKEIKKNYEKIKIYLETNATLVDNFKKIVQHVDVCCINLKLPTDDERKVNVVNLAEEFIKICKVNKKNFFVKIVISAKLYNKTTFKTINQFFTKNKVDTLVLQPETTALKQNQKKIFFNICHIFNILNKKIRCIHIIPQLHKLVWKIK